MSLTVPQDKSPVHLGYLLSEELPLRIAGPVSGVHIDRAL